MSIITTAFGVFTKAQDALKVVNSVIDAGPALIEAGIATAEKVQEGFDKAHEALNQLVDLPGGHDELEEALAKLKAQRLIIARIRDKYAPDND